MLSARFDHGGAEIIVEVWPAIDSVRGPVAATFLARACTLTTALAPPASEHSTFLVSANHAPGAIEQVRRGIEAGRLVPFDSDVAD